jgi:hypothetical protein
MWHDNPNTTALGNKKAARGRLSRCITGLTLGELFASASLVQTDFLTLDLSRIPRHQTRFLESWL